MESVTSLQTALVGEGEARLGALPHCILHRIFHRLSPRDLSHTSAVCRVWRDLNRDIVGENRWQQHYRSRWALHSSSTRPWANLYSEKALQTGAYKGRFSHDGLFGHRSGVRCIQLLPEQNVLATGSMDRSVKLWDLESGMHVCTSRLHEGTVRSIALERHRTTDALRLISGCETTIRIWSVPMDDAKMELGEPVRIKGHSGPISSLSLMNDVLFSGSWDCSVCLWNGAANEKWSLTSRFVYGDWVWAVRAKERYFVVCSGRKVIVQSIETGKEVRSLPESLTEGHVTSCEATQDERYLMTGATDGVVRLYDIRCRNQMTEVTTHGAGITGVSFEDPWIAAGSLDGTISLINIEERLHPELQSMQGVNKQSNSNRQLQCHSGPVYCLDVRDQWIACGAEQSTVRTWDFTKAAAAAKKAEIARMIRRNRKNQTQHPLLPLRVDPVYEELEEEDAPTNEASADEGLSSEQVPSSCRMQHRQSRRNTFWNSFTWGDSTDDSEIIDAFG